MHSFKEYLKNQEYSNEQEILSKLPNLNLVQQVQLDIALHNDAISKNTFYNQNRNLATDSLWKENLISIFQGKLNDPILIKKIIALLYRDIETHKRSGNPITGSEIWHKTWIHVYSGWLNKLKTILGAFNGQA